MYNPKKYITATNRGTLTHYMYTATIENVTKMLSNHCNEIPTLKQVLVKDLVSSHPVDQTSSYT